MLLKYVIIFERIFVRFGSSGESAYLERKTSFFETTFSYFDKPDVEVDGIILTNSLANFDFIM